MTTAYLAYLNEVKQLNRNTISNTKTQLRYILEWADTIPFSKAPNIRPAFPRYVADRLAPSSVELACGTARRFFEWMRLSDKRIGKSINELWCKTLVKPRIGFEIKDYHEYSLDEVRQLMNVQPDSIRMERDRAATAFLFLSGMRIGAFSSMPILAVDLDESSVRQWPELGVNTKLGKKATTFLLAIPELMLIVRQWDALVRSQLPYNCLWYAPFDIPTDSIRATKAGGNSRGLRFSNGLYQLCDLAGVEYRSPHHLRHGFAVYGLKAARDMADMEAVSKNLMHESLTVTLRVYAVLREGDVKSRIVNLGR